MMDVPSFTDGQIVGIHSCIVLCENHPDMKGSELGDLLRKTLDMSLGIFF